MNEPARLIVFDAVGTLIRPVESISLVYQRFGHQHGIELDQATVKRRFTEARQRLFSNNRRQPSSESQEKASWFELVQSVFESLEDCEDLFESLWNYYAGPENWRLFPDVAHSLDQLWNHQYSISIASNFDSRLIAICAAIPPLDRIENVFHSGKLGFRKPDPRFYHKIRDILSLIHGTNVNPTMIGDDFEKDVQAARDAGWLAMHLKRTNAGLKDLTDNLIS